MALKPRMSVQLPMNLLICQNSKVKVSLWKNTIILVNGAALTRNILFSRLDLSKDPGPLPNGGAGGSHFYLALQPLRESRDAAGGGDHADAGTVRLGRPILPSSLYLGIALIIGYL